MEEANSVKCSGAVQGQPLPNTFQTDSISKTSCKRNYPPEASSCISSVLMRYYSNQHQAKQLLTFFPTPASPSCGSDQLCFWGSVCSHRTTIIKYQLYSLFLVQMALTSLPGPHPAKASQLLLSHETQNYLFSPHSKGVH